MGINTNTLNMGSSSPAQGLNPARPETLSTGQVAGGRSQGSDSSFGSGSGPAQAGSSATGGSGPAGTRSGAAGGAVGGQKAAGPTAQTRNAQSAQNPSASRATAQPGPRTQSAGSAGNQAGTGTGSPDAGHDCAANFGSVLSTALGQGATGTHDKDSAAKATSDATGTATPAQLAPGASADAVAWFTQVLVPSAATATPPAAPTTAKPDSSPAAGVAAALGAAAGVVPASIDAGPPAQSPAGQAPNAQGPNAQAPTGQASAGQAPAGQAPAGQTPSGQASDTRTAATASALSGPGNIDALADVQQLIAGLSGANSTTNPGAAPATHAAAADAGTDAAQAAAAAVAALTRTDPGLGTATLTIQAPVGSAAFAAELSARVAGMAPGLTPSGITQAQLQLNPVALGPVQVHITLQAGQASVWFGATHPDTRAALEQSLPQLRELFAGAGMPLTDSGVFREPPRQRQAPSLPLSGIAHSTAGDVTAAPTVTQVANIRLALLDTYA